MHRICAISPCPNDIYTFSGLLTKNVPHRLEFRVAPIGDLNRFALNGEVDIAKISAGTFALVQHRYQLTRVGASFGEKNGPKLVMKRGSIVADELVNETVLGPGLSTTASFVVDKFFPQAKQIEAPLDRIPSLIASGDFKLGILLNEAMQDLVKYDLEVIFDLAKLWRERMGGLLPLGVVVASKKITSDEKTAFENAVRASLAWAKANHQEATHLACQWASEKSEEAVLMHIQDFTNSVEDNLNNQVALDSFLALINQSVVREKSLSPAFGQQGISL